VRQAWVASLFDCLVTNANRAVPSSRRLNLRRQPFADIGRGFKLTGLFQEGIALSTMGKFTGLCFDFLYLPTPLLFDRRFVHLQHSLIGRVDPEARY
jgi:hypothetical protein